MSCGQSGRNINNGEQACSVALMRWPDGDMIMVRGRAVSAAAAGRRRTICAAGGGPTLYCQRECTVCACKLLMVSAF